MDVCRRRSGEGGEGIEEEQVSCEVEVEVEVERIRGSSGIT